MTRRSHSPIPFPVLAFLLTLVACTTAGDETVPEGAAADPFATTESAPGDSITRFTLRLRIDRGKAGSRNLYGVTQDSLVVVTIDDVAKADTNVTRRSLTPAETALMRTALRRVRLDTLAANYIDPHAPDELAITILAGTNGGREREVRIENMKLNDILPLTEAIDSLIPDRRIDYGSYVDRRERMGRKKGNRK